MWTIDMQIDEVKLHTLLKEAAREGAQQALREIGLHDELAGRDVHDLRELILGWRDIKATATRTAVKWFILLILGVLSTGVYFTVNR
jgi:hypothetical protein